jgi:hypothetical protein
LCFEFSHTVTKVVGVLCVFRAPLHQHDQNLLLPLRGYALDSQNGTGGMLPQLNPSNDQRQLRSLFAAPAAPTRRLTETTAVPVHGLCPSDGSRGYIVCVWI